MSPLLVSSGEPAGIGPDICLNLAGINHPLVVMGDLSLLAARAKLLNKNIHFQEYQKGMPLYPKPDTLIVLPVSCAEIPKPGILNKSNAPYVLELLRKGADLCGRKEFSALVTAPVHKGIINEAGIPFTGHTEFFADYYGVPTVVMLLACKTFKVALITTHLALKDVPQAINQERIRQVLTQLSIALQKDFNIKEPQLFVAGLNPHAGEGGYLGKEEIEIIHPALEALRKEGLHIQGPLSADTMFSTENLEQADAFVAMYHDQGLPVLKYAGFGDAVNITLGLPIIRTSVDHGTALELAGTGKAATGSLMAATQMAASMVFNREKYV